MVNILTINSILVNIDIISDSYVNGSTQPTIYSFFPYVSPGYTIIENPHNLLYLPITADTIHSIHYEERICQCDFIWEWFKIISWVLKMTPMLKCEYQRAKKTSSRKHLNLIASLSQFVSSFQICTVQTSLP